MGIMRHVVFLHCFYLGIIRDIVKCPLDVHEYCNDIVILKRTPLQFCNCAWYCTVRRFAFLEGIYWCSCIGLTSAPSSFRWNWMIRSKSFHRWQQSEIGRKDLWSDQSALLGFCRKETIAILQYFGVYPSIIQAVKIRTIPSSILSGRFCSTMGLMSSGPAALCGPNKSMPALILSWFIQESWVTLVL